MFCPRTGGYQVAETGWEHDFSDSLFCALSSSGQPLKFAFYICQGHILIPPNEGTHLI